MLIFFERDISLSINHKNIKSFVKLRFLMPKMGYLHRLFAILSLETLENLVLFPELDLCIMVQKVYFIENLKSGKRSY